MQVILVLCRIEGFGYLVKPQMWKCKILNEMDAETAKHYAEVRYTVSEAKYNNAPPEIKEKLKDCRTVFLQGTSFDIEEIE